MSQQPLPPYGTLNVVDGALSEPVTYNAGNVATNISDGVSTG
jgi:hypothetical protein